MARTSKTVWKISKRAIAILATSIIVATSSISAKAGELRLLSSWSPSTTAVYRVVEEFEKNVAEIGGGEVTLNISGPEVVPSFEQIQPVSAGAFDMLFTHGVYHAGTKGIALIGDALAPDMELRRSSGVWDAIDAYYQENNNLKMIAMSPMSEAGFHIILREPMSKDGRLDGLRIRGTASYHGVINSLGGAPVVLPTSEIYPALEKGVVDGVAYPAGGMLSLKLYEVAGYRTRPTFPYGGSNLPIFVNLDKWNSLSEAEQNVLLEAGKKLEMEMPAIGAKLQVEEDKALDELGVKYTYWTDEQHKAIVETWNNSVWELGVSCCGDEVNRIREMAVRAGLSN